MPTARRWLWNAIGCGLLLAPGAQADMGRWCEPRALSAAEKQAGERIAERLRKSLPAAPQGWKIAAERIDVVAGACKSEASGRLVPQPVSVTIARRFLRNDPPQAPANAPAQPAPAQPLSSPEDQARAAELETSIAQLKRREADAVAAYQAARRTGDSAAQREATQASRQYRAEMAPLQRELMELRRAQSGRRAADSEARTHAAQARMAEARAHRRDASVSIQVNAAQAAMRGAEPVPASGASLALRERAGATHLLFGDWRHSGSFAMATIDESAATTRVQAVHVRIDGSDDMSTELLRALDLNAVKEVMNRER